MTALTRTRSTLICARILKTLIAGAAATTALQSFAMSTGDAQVDRGKYLVRLAGCNDCHTAGYFFGKPNMSHYLAGSDVGFPLAGGGLAIGRNLTPDKETGIGNWTVEQIVTTIRSGVRPDGRVLAPVMPYASYANLTTDDATAIALYLKSLKPVRNKIPGPFAANETPTTFRWQILPPPAASAGDAAAR